MQKYQIAIDKIMLLNALQTDLAETTELFGISFFYYLLLGTVLPSLPVIAVKIRFLPWRQEIRQRLYLITFSLAAIAIIAYSGSSYTAQFLRNNRSLKYRLLPVNYIGAAISAVKITLRKVRPLVSVGHNATFRPYWNNDKKNLIVLVIGETARAANFSLGGYARPTNSALMPENDNIYYFNDVSSCGTSTAVSLPCMLSAAGRRNFQTGSENYTENILDIINRNGYHVLWRENNSGCKNLCNRVETETFCANYQCKDEILLRNLPEKIRGLAQNTLVVLHQQGSHGPAYYRRYPSETAPFSPACRDEDFSRCSREEIVNAYDNSIAYTSYMLAETIRRLQPLESEYNITLLYISDHGESLGENGIYLHAAPYLIAPKEQTGIPFFIWFSPQTGAALHINRHCLRQKLNRSFSHDNLFHTLLGLSGISADEYLPELDILASCRQ